MHILSSWDGGKPGLSSLHKTEQCSSGKISKHFVFRQLIPGQECLSSLSESPSGMELLYVCLNCSLSVQYSTFVDLTVSMHFI